MFSKAISRIKFGQKNKSMATPSWFMGKCTFRQTMNKVYSVVMR